MTINEIKRRHYREEQLKRPCNETEEIETQSSSSSSSPNYIHQPMNQPNNQLANQPKAKHNTKQNLEMSMDCCKNDTCQIIINLSFFFLLLLYSGPIAPFVCLFVCFLIHLRERFVWPYSSWSFSHILLNFKDPCVNFLFTHVQL